MRMILDGNNLAYRAFHAPQPLTKKDGTDVTTVYGVLKMLQSYIKPSEGNWTNRIIDAVQAHTAQDKAPLFSEVHICWDGGKSKARQALFPDYKGQRTKQREEKTPEEKAAYARFQEQITELNTVLPAFGIKSYVLDGWEADDLVYLLSGDQPDEIAVIISNDKDMLQLVDVNTFVYYPLKETLVTSDNFQEFTGLPHVQYLDYRVMVGDTSDNINGIKGIGDKKAKGLLLKYGSLSNALADEITLRKSKVTARLFDDSDILIRNIKLMDLSTMDYSSEGVIDYVSQVQDTHTEFDSQYARAVLMHYEFVSLVANFTDWTYPFTKLKY